MDISINGVKADITLDTEKNLGEVLSGIEVWLREQGCFVSGLLVDGEPVLAESLGPFCGKELTHINSLDVNVLSWPELALQAYSGVLEALTAYQDASFDAKQKICAEWEQSASGHFLSEHTAEIFDLIRNSLSGEGLAPAVLKNFIDERLRELESPKTEFRNMEVPVSGIAVRLQDLPLDIQTGKDEQAAETIQLFSNVMEKLYRLMYILKYTGITTENVSIESVSFQNFNDEFSAALKELATAYQVKDAVLVGDLAEYELAPRLVALYSSLKELV
jgi:hypothetical protein